MGFPEALMYKDSALCAALRYNPCFWVSQEPYCTSAVPHGDPSSPTVQGQYPRGTPAALMYKKSTL